MGLLQKVHCVRIRNFSSPNFPTFGLSTERYSVRMREKQTKKLRIRAFLTQWSNVTMWRCGNVTVVYLRLILLFFIVILITQTCKRKNITITRFSCIFPVPRKNEKKTNWNRNKSNCNNNEIHACINKSKIYVQIGK